MIPSISIIIPTRNRKELLDSTVLSITNNFKAINYENYEVIVVSSETQDNFNCDYSDKVKVYSYKNRLYPGIARNIGLENSNFEWVWFIDDDDQIDNNRFFDLINKIDPTFDIIAHSLKKSYKSNNVKQDLINQILMFREKQEVFNYIIKKNILQNNNIKFSDGLHEDIRFIVELLLSSNSINVLDLKAYNKITREDSITKNLTFDRIDGYFNAATEILNLNHDLVNKNKDRILVQFLGVVLYLVDQLDYQSKIDYIEYIDKNIPNFFITDTNKNYTKKDTNFKYAVSLFLNKKTIEDFISELDYCFKTELSCKDLKHSIFLGPSKIIGCCKRFFYEGQMKGDIVLMNNSSDITLDKILDRKLQVEKLINEENFIECKGCPYIERYEKTKNEKVDYISLENFTYCNMRCNYCSPTYYGGKEPSYDTEQIIDQLLNGDYLADGVHIVWGGGEPTLKPKFKEITNNLLNSKKVSKVRVLSNSLRFSEGLNEIAANEKIRIVTSIDAGTQEKFKEVRGKGEILKVLENLNRYKKNINQQENLTLKYIMTEDNYFSDELEEFVKLIKENGFEDNLIQISCNFKLESPTREMIYALYELAGRLFNSGFKFVFFDDLIRDRLKLDRYEAEQLIQHLVDTNLMHENIVYHLSNINIILWGNGYQSKWIKDKTNFGKANKVIKVVSDKTELTSEDINNSIICPAGIQSLPEIYKEIKRSNLENKTKFLIFI